MPITYRERISSRLRQTAENLRNFKVTNIEVRRTQLENLVREKKTLKDMLLDVAPEFEGKGKHLLDPTKKEEYRNAARHAKEQFEYTYGLIEKYEKILHIKSDPEQKARELAEINELMKKIIGA